MQDIDIGGGAHLALVTKMMDGCHFFVVKARDIPPVA
jgi:hypothetical protein